MNRNSFLVRTPVNVGEDELGVSFSFSFTKPLTIIALDLMSLIISGFSYHGFAARRFCFQLLLRRKAYICLTTTS